MGKKHILIVGTGGTITAKIIDDRWAPGSFSEEDLINFVPEVKTIADVTTVDLFRIDSSNMQPENWLKLAQFIYENAEEYDGVVITHGTDTMHYTASALSFLLQNLPFPVVLTGSQIPPHKIGSDAKRNLLDSIRVAAETDICEVAIVFNRNIFRGNRTKYFRELEFDAFESIGTLPLGLIEHDIRKTGESYREKEKGKLKYWDKMEENVCIVKISPGMKPEIMDQLFDLEYKGLVLEGFGAGNVPVEGKAFVPKIKQAMEEGIPIVVSTQCAIGTSWMHLYEAGKKALDAGAIPGHDMVSETAMTKLMWILGNFDLDVGGVKELFLKNIAGEISPTASAQEKMES